MRQHNTLLVRLTDDADFQLVDDVNMAQDADDQDTSREDGNNSLENNEGIMEAKDAQFEESKHPRADNGQFTSGGGEPKGSAGNSNENKKVDNQNVPKTFRSPFSSVGINLEDPYTLLNYSYIKKNIETKIKDFSDFVENKTGSLKKVGEMQLEMAKAELERLENFYKKAKEDPMVQKLFQRKNTAKDSGYSASLKGADSVSKEENKMTEELKARDGDLVIKHDDEEEEVKDASVDKRELIREIGAIAGQAGMSEELVRTLMQKAEQLAYNGSEQSEATDACGKDEDAEMEEEFKETEDSDDEKDDEKISKLVEKKVEDALNGIDLLALIEAKKNMLEKVRPLVGDFDASKMTNNDIAKYACDKLNIKATSDSANDVLDCYLNMKGNTKIYSTADSIDDSADDIIARYKRGE